MSIYETTDAYLEPLRRAQLAQAWAENTEVAGPHIEQCANCGEHFNHDNDEIFPSAIGDGAWLCVPCCPVGRDYEAVPPGFTLAQYRRIITFCANYGVEFDPRHYGPSFDLPKGYVAGWIGGKPGTIFVGVDIDGEASS